MGCNLAKPTRKRGGARVVRHLQTDITLRAVLLIQRWYRAYKERMRLRQRTTWEIFQCIEHADSHDQLRLFNFFNALLSNLDKSAPRRSSSVGDQTRRHQIIEMEYQGFYQGFRNYKGPHVTLPLDRSQLDKLLLFFSMPTNTLHPRDVFIIMRAAAMHLEKLPNVNLCSTAVSKQMTVVGDLHGQLQDLLTIFNKNSLPSNNNPYIFNGDYVDRGPMGIEVLVILLSCFMVFPQAVFLNRGNHEDKLMNERYGFVTELNNKYGDTAPALLSVIEDVYRFLPLASVLNNKVFIAHGGISTRVNLPELRRINRANFFTILCPPVLEDMIITTQHWEIVFDLLWSDPHENYGQIPNKIRGAGTRWGSDITNAFLVTNRMEYIIRSHECKLKGYDQCHYRNVITIFSASNYYAPGSNKGAYLKIDSTLEYFFKPFVVNKRKYVEMRMAQKMDIVEQAAIRELLIRLYRNRDKLLQEFEKYDEKGMGMIDVRDWCRCMEKISEMHLPWFFLVEKLAPKPEYYEGKPFPKGKVSYFSTRDLLDDEEIVEAFEVGHALTISLYKDRNVLETIFNIIDADNSGSITVAELNVVLKWYGIHLTDEDYDDEAQKLIELMDFNRDGVVDLNEFLEAFRLSR